MLPRDLIKRLGTFEIDHFDFEGNFEPDTPSDPHERAASVCSCLGTCRSCTPCPLFLQR